MKVSISLVILFINFAITQAQIYVAGDTTQRFVYYPEHILSNSSAAIQIDCADSTDLQFDSHSGGQFYHDWSRLSFWLHPNAEVLNSGIGLVTRFQYGDTIRLTEDIWTHSLDFIWGAGVMGNYGVAQIDTAYIAFRKINTNDTAYVFLKISTSASWMKIHQIISECAVNPLQAINAIGEITNGEEVLVYPNPFSNQLTCTLPGNEQTTVTLYNFLGQQVWQHSFTNSTVINTAQMQDGIYFYELRNKNGLLKTGKLVKQ